MSAAELPDIPRDQEPIALPTGLTELLAELVQAVHDLRTDLSVDLAWLGRDVNGNRSRIVQIIPVSDGDTITVNGKPGRIVGWAFRDDHSTSPVAVLDDDRSGRPHVLDPKGEWT